MPENQPRTIRLYHLILENGCTPFRARGSNASDRGCLKPLRAVLADTPWLGGDRPNYSDYCGLSAFLWAASINTSTPLEPTDPLFD